MSKPQTHPKWLRELLQKPEHSRWQATIGTHHIRLTHPDAIGPVFAAKTPSDRRALDNIIGTMRRSMKAGSHV